MSGLNKKDISRRSFQSLLKQIYDTSRETPPDRYSTYWFFLRYVRRLLKTIESLNEPKQLDPTIRGITRFYVDLDNPSTLISEQFESIRAAYALLKRVHQSSDDISNRF